MLFQMPIIKHQIKTAETDRVSGSVIFARSGRVRGQHQTECFDRVLSFNMRIYCGNVSAD